MFIERPKSLSAQAATWSDYKHHNTFKFLVGIRPTGFYFVSFFFFYGGRTRGKFITKDSRFYYLLERDDEVIADSICQIQENLPLHFFRLVVPPGARVKSQMTKSEVKKAKEVPNLQIHVERGINRIKIFRVLKVTIPVTMIQHVYDIILTGATLCNLRPKLIRTIEKDLKK